MIGEQKALELPGRGAGGGRGCSAWPEAEHRLLPSPEAMRSRRNGMEYAEARARIGFLKIVEGESDGALEGECTWLRSRTGGGREYTESPRYRIRFRMFEPVSGGVLVLRPWTVDRGPASLPGIMIHRYMLVSYFVS